MAATDYTDLFARFNDKVAAELLANYIADSGFSCDLVEISDSGFGRRYGTRVARSLIEDLKENLKLTPVAKYREVVSPEVVAGRLAREKIPCYVGGPPVLTVGAMGGPGYTGVPTAGRCEPWRPGHVAEPRYRSVRRAALITVRRAICERFPPERERRAWLRWVAGQNPH